MKPIDLFLLAILAVVVLGAALILVRSKKHGRSCCNSCGGCSGCPQGDDEK